MLVLWCLWMAGAVLRRFPDVLPAADRHGERIILPRFHPSHPFTVLYVLNGVREC
jgi:hypothetical protein